jgi:succinate dehydrogenase / fumarate reductase cytochrome b subunit
MGLWLVIYLIEHLLTNSQAALWIDNDGSGFVKAVNAIQNLPYIHVIEILLIGIPFAIHTIWGIQYLWMSKMNSHTTDGTKPSLPEYPRNHNYSWQRITSWILLVALIIHVMQFRIMEYPSSAKLGPEDFYMVRVSLDEGLYTVAKRLNVTLYDQNMINLQRLDWHENVDETTLSAGFFGSFYDFFKGIFTVPTQKEVEENQIKELLKIQEKKQQRAFLDALEDRKLGPGEVIAVAPDFGTAELLVVRETFKMPFMLIFYTLFVITAVFHAFNGFWTFLITWGVSLTERSQNMMQKLAVLLMVVIGFLGLAAIWGTYLITLNS